MGKKLSKFNEKPIENRYLARKTRKFSACGAVLVKKIVIFTIFSDKIAAEGREKFWDQKILPLFKSKKKTLVARYRPQQVPRRILCG